MAIDQMALIDLLTRLRDQSPPSIGPEAGGGMAPFAAGPAMPQADPRAALLQQYFQPQQPQMVPEGPQVSRGREIGSTIAAALGDALATYGGAVGRFPVNANAAPQLMERIRQGREARGENARRKMSAEDEAKRARAGYELGQMDKAETLKRQDTIRAEDTAARQAERAEDRQFRAGEAERSRNFELETIKRSETLQREMSKLRSDTELAQERMRQAGKDDVDKVALRQEAQAERETTTQGIQYVVGTANTLAEKLAQPGANAEAVRKQAKRALDALGVRGKAREEVWRYWIEEVEPDLQSWEQANAPMQGPQNEPGLAPGLGRALQSPALRFSERR